MNRRELLLLAGAMAMARPLRAQQKSMSVIGLRSGGASGAFAPAVAAFRQGLSATGYVEGQNVTIEYRWAEGRYDRLPSLAAELARDLLSPPVTMKFARCSTTISVPSRFTLFGLGSSAISPHRI